MFVLIAVRRFVLSRGRAAMTMMYLHIFITILTDLTLNSFSKRLVVPFFCIIVKDCSILCGTDNLICNVLLNANTCLIISLMLLVSFWCLHIGLLLTTSYGMTCGAIIFAGPSARSDKNVGNIIY
jgi:hypothetical protein